MKTIFMRPWILVAMLLSFFSLKGFAQMYGSGMMGGMQACPYQQEIGDDAESKLDDIEDANDRLKEIREKLAEAKSEKRDIESKVKRAKENLERRGFKSEYLERILDHIETGRSCSAYEMSPTRPTETPTQNSSSQPTKILNEGSGAGQNPADRQKTGMNEGGDVSRMPADEKTSSNNSSTTNVSGNGREFKPFRPTEWFDKVCDSAADGRIMSDACKVRDAQLERLFSEDLCISNLKGYQDYKKKLKDAEKKFDILTAEEQAAKDYLAGLKSDFKSLVKQHQKDLKKEATEGGCIECMMHGSGYYAQSSKPNWGGVITNTVLGLGSMILGNSLQKYTAYQSARAGKTPPSAYPSFGYGFPFIMGAMAAAGGAGGGYYGAVGGGMGNGVFGCGGGYGGNGYGNMVGGPFGYPPGYFQTPYGGGLFTGYPMGMMAGGGMFVGGQIMVGGMPMGMMAGGGMMMGGYPMGGMMMGYPMGMMAGGQMMMGGMQMGGYPMGGMMMGMPMGMMAGGQMMMGGMPMGGYPMGMMAGGGMMMGYPMGMMAGGQMMMGGMMGMPMGMAGGMDTSGMMAMQMQMQQQAMQMQQQQMQAAMQQQQRAQENYANGTRVIMSLQQEMASIQMRMQQAMMSIQSGGYMNFGSAGSFGGSIYMGTPGYQQPGIPGGTTIPGQIPGQVPGSVTPTGPSSSR